MDKQLRELTEKFLAEHLSPTKVQGSSAESNSTQDFKDFNILVGTAAYAGMLNHVFVSSLIALSQTMVNLGIRHQIKFVANISLVTAARNALANALFEGDRQGHELTHLLMLDSDQGFESADLVKMISANKEIIALPASLKEFNWDRMAQAAKHGAYPRQLKRFGGVQNFDDLPGAQYSTDAPIAEVANAGAAIMLVKKSVFEKLSAAHPEWKCRRWPNWESPNQREWDFNFFQTIVDSETGYTLPEDFFFTKECRKIGIPTHIIPGAVTTHMGSFDFTWDATSIAELNMRVAGSSLSETLL